MAPKIRLDESALWKSRDAQQKWRKLVEEQHKLDNTKCQIFPDPFIDFPQIVSDEHAEELCYKCPLLKLCYDYAVANDETWGIWGGVNFTDATQHIQE